MEIHDCIYIYVYMYMSLKLTMRILSVAVWHILKGC